jgi:cellulose 1,4-beta-cellobiosidase
MMSFHRQDISMIRPHLLAILCAAQAVSACGTGKNQAGDAPAIALDQARIEASRRNPFSGARFFINPEYVAQVEQAAQLAPADAETIRKVAQYPSGLWLHSVEHVGKIPIWLDAARKQQQDNGRPTLSVFVVYNMPNRDCSAKSSAGDLKMEKNGAHRYRKEFIDPIAAHFQAYPDLPIVVILEPGSLANLATNLSIPACAEARSAYLEATVYAIQRLGLPNVSLYLDAAHSGWLGWDQNREKVAKVYKEVLKLAGGFHTIRGFATNIANYSHLSNRDGLGLEDTNPCYNESVYVKKLAVTLGEHGFRGKGFIIDTSRNGRGKIRRTWDRWCNIKDAGLGERPVADPDVFVDAYFWVKPPGESDGTSDPTQPHFDPACTSPDSASGAPPAGEWFQSHFLNLVRNATPPL